MAILCGLAAAFALVVSRPALAADQPPSVDVYTEQVPTASGNVVVGHVPATTAPTSAPLSPRSEQALRKAGKQAPVLRKVAKSPQLGAPQRRLPRERAAAKAPRVPLASAIGAAATGGRSGEGVALLVAIVLAPLFLGGLALRELRSRNGGAR